uniref:Immunoglobulin V-set domain-containing protein n=1 Tax=Pundamilia nyererei TaxID=303518 RepID=A0A3B4F871_9CICH
MWVTLFLPFALRCVTSAVGVIHVTGYVGRESIVCPYESRYQNNPKYICRGNRPSTCRQQALITSDNKQNGRFRLDDDKLLGTFTVNISSLTKNDSGSYLCGVQRNSDLDVFSAVELKVKGERMFIFLLRSVFSFCFSDARHYVVYTVPPLLLLLMCVFAVIVHKCKHQRVKGIFCIHRHAKMYLNVHGKRG